MLCLAGLCLTLPSLFIGFYQDDFVARYIYSDLDGARDLYRAYAGGYGISNGVPADNHWQAEAGHAPWWIYPELQLALFRPISQATHILDVRLWSSNALLMHAHSLLWFAALILAATRMYRGALGTVVGGMAALLFAVDHTHGFLVGYITNRHALISALFGVLCIDQHFRARAAGKRWPSWTALLFYGLALLSGELSVTVLGYVLGYALFVEKGSLLRRGLSFAPYVLLTALWRAGYAAAGYGVFGSGIYIDISREPMRFFTELLERGPVLILGQFLAPPPEIMYLASESLARGIVIFAVIFLLLLAATFTQLARRSPTSRMWLLGMLISLVPASSTFPHSRQLMFTSIGAMALLAEFWQLYAVELRDKKHTLVAKLVALPGVSAFVLHLVGAPLVLPFATCSVALARRFHQAVARVGDEIAGRDLVFVNAPDYLATRLVQLMRRVDHRPLPRRWRALSFGAQPVTIHRPGERTLLVDYAGGILGTPLSELYRDRRLRMSPGDHVELEGLDIHVRSVTADGRVQSAEFVFDRSLDDPRFCFYFWGEEGFAPFTLPKIGDTAALAAPVVKL